MDKWDICIDLFWHYFMSPDPEGAPRAKELIKWFVVNNGATFKGDRPTWERFMRSQTKIKDEEKRFYDEYALELCQEKKEKSGTFTRNARQLSLESEAMKFTLHGCHRLEVKGSYRVEIKGGDYIVSFDDNTWTWIDRGDLHGNLATKLKSGVVIPDQALIELGNLLGGKEYPIEISWGVSKKVKVPRDKSKCGADCKDFKEYGTCDNRTYDNERCYRHR